jgi:hypothetical protein
VQCGAESLHALVWIAHIGRARLVLLDSNSEANPPHLRELTATLYGGDELTRIRQEILLGIGGLTALRALGIRPSILHLNEGHSAFAVLERMRERMEDGLSFEDALRESAIHTVAPCPTRTRRGAVYGAWADQREQRARTLLHDRPRPEGLETSQWRVESSRSCVAAYVANRLARPIRRRRAELKSCRYFSTLMLRGYPVDGSAS